MKKDVFLGKSWDSVHNGKTLPIMCYLCGEDNPSILKKIESHHLFGKAHSDVQVPLCLNCHTKITSVQNRVNPKKRSKKASKKHKIGYLLVTQGRMLELIGRKSQEIGAELLKDG